MTDRLDLLAGNDVPFDAWQCITLSIKKKGDIYLIIKNENVMTMFLKFLIYHMETFDGNRGSAQQFINMEAMKLL